MPCVDLERQERKRTEPDTRAENSSGAVRVWALFRVLPVVLSRSVNIVISQWTPPIFRRWIAAGVAAMVVGGVGCRAMREPDPAPSAAVEFRTEKLDALDGAVRDAIQAGKAPGGVLWLERRGAIYAKAYGDRVLVPQPVPMGTDTIFDAASLTKVIATTPSIMLLVERGQIELSAPVARYLPEFAGEGRDTITVRQLLTHTSGLRPGIPGRPAWEGYDRGVELACRQQPTSTPGTRWRYSDINFILLGEIVRRVSGMPLNEFSRREIFEPLGMVDTGFLPGAEKRLRIAPTEVVDGEAFHGVVHDPTSRRMGGVAGHAGLFVTAADLARFARMMLNRGEWNGTRIFAEETVALMTSVQTPPEVPQRRGLGWDIDSPYSSPRGAHFPIGSFGHTGWTGTSIWMDPFSQTFLVFLSNRNHPTEEGSVVQLRRTLATIAAEAVRSFNFVYVPGALSGVSKEEKPSGDGGRTRSEAESESDRESASTAEVLNGIDVLARDEFKPLRGFRVGLITNHTGIDRGRRSTIDLLHAADGVQLAALFSPEHGIRGVLDAKVEDDRDPKTGLTIFSLYGESRKPLPEQLAGLDALVFDIQDIGCRFYTYISTMGLAMEAAAENGLKFFVLDRVNPINGVAIEGPVYRGDSKFIAFHALPIRHGMTVGELAGMFRAERGLDLDLTVIQIEGWRRELWFDETGLPWVNPSPNMRNLTEAMLYPGIGLLETAVSVGRGTDTPFETLGAPFIDDVALSAALNGAGLPGIRFVPVRFTPDASVFRGQECRGLSLILTDRDRCPIVETGIEIARTLRGSYPDQFDLEKYNRLLLDQTTLAAIRDGRPRESIVSSWTKDLFDFRQRRAQYLLYP